jgi:hypothetical protein
MAAAAPLQLLIFRHPDNHDVLPVRFARTAVTATTEAFRPCACSTIPRRVRLLASTSWSPICRAMLAASVANRSVSGRWAADVVMKWAKAR